MTFPFVRQPWVGVAGTGDLGGIHREMDSRGIGGCWHTYRRRDRDGIMSSDGGLGLIGMCAGAVGVFAGLVWIGYPPAVDDSVYSYPFTAAGFTVAQAVLTVRDLASAGPPPGGRPGLN